MNLEETLNRILFDVQFNAGRFAAIEGYTTDEVRDIAVQDILDAVKAAGYGPAAYAGS